MTGGPSNGKKAYPGLSLGLGSQWMRFQSNGLGFDVMYLATTGLDIDKLKNQGYNVKDPGKVKISIGYRHAF